MPTHPRIAFPGLRAAAAAWPRHCPPARWSRPRPLLRLPQPTLTPVAFTIRSASPAAARIRLRQRLPICAASCVAARRSDPGRHSRRLCRDGRNFPHDPRLAERRAAAVADILREVRHRRLGHPATGRVGSGQRARRASFGRHEVILPGCPNWSREPGYDPGNLPLSNLGCATAFNLGLMVADPGGSGTRRPLGPADGTQRPRPWSATGPTRSRQLEGGNVQ